MTFTSPSFLTFLILVCSLQFFVNAAGKRLALILASFFFIASFNIASLLALVLLSSFNFGVGRQLVNQQSLFLFRLAVLINCLAIVLNNYLAAANGKFTFSFGTVAFKIENTLFLIGLSFYSLQHIAYLTDVQKRRLPSEMNYLDFLLTSCYFPKFMSGPVTLYQQLKTQLPSGKPSQKLMWQGFNRMLLGFFKKMVLADRLAPSVASVFDYKDVLPGITIFIAAVFFTIQLYFDFSGYCDIAIGASKLLGIALPENFNFPFRSSSVTIFWRRWHQSLIAFFTTYVFYPVSFRYRRLKKQAAALAIVVTFLISGLWHGIGFTFLAWACCHIVYLLVELYLRKNNSLKQKDSFLKLAGGALIVLMLVAFSNLFFRASSTENAFRLMRNLFNGRHFFPESWAAGFLAPLAVGGHQLEQFNLFITLFFTAGTLLFERKIFALGQADHFKARVTFVTVLLIFVFGVFNNGQRFIYMQF